MVGFAIALPTLHFTHATLAYTRKGGVQRCSTHTHQLKEILVVQPMLYIGLPKIEALRNDFRTNFGLPSCKSLPYFSDVSLILYEFSKR